MTGRRVVGLHAELAAALFAVALLTAAAVSLIVNVSVRREFAEHVAAEQRRTAAEIAANLALQYDGESGEWNTDYIHGFGMYALGEGYVVKVTDISGRVLWDAEHHDTTQCHAMMARVADFMERKKPSLRGQFESMEFPLTNGAERIGTARIGMYAPYSMNEDDFRFLEAFNRIIMIAGILSALAAAAAGYIFAGKLVSPIKANVGAIREISGGNYDIRLDCDGRTKELRELGRAVNRMSDDLEKQENMRKRIVADVAHELRTPLTNISTHLEMMREGIWEASEERLTECMDEAGRLASLVGELSALSRAESGAEPLNLAETDIGALLRSAASSFEGRAKQKSLAVEISCGDVSAVADAEKLRRAVTNLLANAVMYTSDGGSITLSARECGECVRIAVKDTGCGISAEDLPHVFERFYRTDRSRRRSSGGAGIGLTIAKAIAEAHGGTISAESEPGKGSIFTITVPRIPQI